MVFEGLPGSRRRMAAVLVCADTWVSFSPLIAMTGHSVALISSVGS